MRPQASQGSAGASLVCQKDVDLSKDCASTMLSQEGAFFTFMCDMVVLAKL